MEQDLFLSWYYPCGKADKDHQALTTIAPNNRQTV